MIEKRIWAACGFALVAQFLFVAAYISGEHTLYFWDHAMYLDMARQLFAYAKLDDAAGAMDYFKEMLGTNYPIFYALPDLLTFYLFGDTRLVFVLTNFVCFLVPQQVALAFLLHRGFSLSWNRALLFSLLGCSVLPPLWVPLLQGYPDHAAAALLSVALVMLLAQGRSWLKAVGLGFILGFAILLRRHHAYGLLTLLFVMSAWDWASLIAKSNSGKSAKEIFILLWKKKINLGPIGTIARLFGFYVLTGASALALMSLLAPDYLKKALTIDYTALYHSYKVDAPVFLQFALNNFGLGLAALALSGLALTYRTNPVVRRVAVWSSLWLVVWCFGPAQTGSHYLLQLLPLVALTGLVGLGLVLASWKNAKRKMVLIGFAVFLSGNAAYSLWFASEGVVPNWRGAAGFLSAPRPPVVRFDYDNLINLASYLQETVRPNDKILVVGSSFDFNQDILRAAYTDVLMEPTAMRFFLQAPEIDDVQMPPYDVFSAATVYVVPEPAQYHLDPSGQKVVTALAQLFPPQGAAAEMFQKDSRRFFLQNGIVVSIYRRVSDWAPMVLHEDLQKIQSVLGVSKDPDLGPHHDWAVTQMPWKAVAATLVDGSSHVQALFGAGVQDLTMFYDYPLPKGSFRFSTFIQAQQTCGAMSFSLVLTTPQGRARVLKNFDAPEKPTSLTPVTANIALEEEGYLSLNLYAPTAPGSYTPCAVLLRNLSVQQN